MGKIMKKEYENILLYNIESDLPENWDVSDATHVRVSLPSGIENILNMQNNGYQFVDRMLDVTIHLNQNRMDLDKLVRMIPVLSREYREEIEEIAVRCFETDRRFHVEVDYNQEVARVIIHQWIEEIPEFYVCLHKDNPIGFLALKEADDEKSAEICLAAVDKKYRSSGAALSLYANALKTGREKGYQRITGYISSYNTAVMNLYSYLGGTFSNPTDIYLRNN